MDNNENKCYEEGKCYTDNQIKWLQQYVRAEINAVREAVAKETITNTAKFEANNDWKLTIKDQISRSPSREELDKFAHKEHLAGIVTREEVVTRDTFDTWKKDNEQWRSTVAPVRNVESLEKIVDELKSALNRSEGAMRVAQFLGYGGLLALLISLLRTIGAIK